MIDDAVDPAEVQYNLSQAEESLAAARQLSESEYSDFAASRAYYAAFYAARAAVVSTGLIRSKHSGVRAAIDEHFVSEIKTMLEKDK